MSKVEQARVAWDGDPPDWVLVLARAVDEAGNQNQVARRLGYSAAAIVGVVKNSYGADTGGIERAVRAQLMAETVECPVLTPILEAEIPLSRCLREQAKPLSTASPLSVQLYRACRGGCAHSHLRPETGRC